MSGPENTAGWIRLQGLRITGVRVGVYPHEKHRPRPIVVDVSMRGEVAKAASSDNLAEALDYAHVAATLRNHATRQHFNLLESMAQHFADVLLRDYPISRVIVEVFKPNAVAGATASVCIERP